MKNFKIFSLTAVLWFISLFASGQDISLTQFFNSPLYLNPGFAGSTPEFRATANSRVQWPSVENPFVTQAISLDYNMSRHYSGLGAFITIDDIGPFTITSVNGLYSYKININEKFIISPGLQFGYVNRNTSINRYRFYSDIVSGQTDEQFVNAQDIQINHFDFGSGVTIFNRKLWGGFSVNHINRPTVSATDQVEKLNLSWSIHGGARIVVPHSPLKQGNNPVVLPSFVYRNQGAFDQLELGVQTHIEPLSFGLAYKGISFQQSNNIDNNKVLAMLFGLTYDRFEVGVSYDFYLAGVGVQSGGAYELALIYQFRAINWQKKKLRKYRGIMNNVPPFYREKWYKLDPSN